MFNLFPKPAVCKWVLIIIFLCIWNGFTLLYAIYFWYGKFNIFEFLGLCWFQSVIKWLKQIYLLSWGKVAKTYQEVPCSKWKAFHYAFWSCEFESLPEQIVQQTFTPPSFCTMDVEVVCSNPAMGETGALFVVEVYASSSISNR